MRFGPVVRLEVLDPAFYCAVAANGSVGAGGAYMDGLWRCDAAGMSSSDALVALIRLLVRNRDLLDGLETGLARLGGAALRVWEATRRNTRTEAAATSRRTMMSATTSSPSSCHRI